MKHFLISQTSREALSKERARELLKGLGEGTKSVKLSGKSFGDGSAEIAASALQTSIPSLTHLDLSDIIASRPEEEAKRTLTTIAAALSSCKHLEFIDLSDNALGAKGIRAVGDLLTGQQKLSKLFLCNNGLAADAGDLICTALIASAPTSLLCLHFHNNLLETSGSIALAPIVENSPFLEDFRFSSLRLGREGAVRICRVLEPRLSLTLRVLNLSDNSFGEEGADALADALVHAPVLEKLIVNDALLGDLGVSSVCDALVKGAPKLIVLNISGNEVSHDGSSGLARLLSQGYLRELIAEDNEIGNAGALLLSEGITETSSLRILTLNSSEIGGRGALAIADAVAKLSNLEVINIDGNFIPTEVLSQIEELLGDSLGPLDDNDEEGEHEEEDDAGEEDVDGRDHGDSEYRDKEPEQTNGITYATTKNKDGGDIEGLVEGLGDLEIKDLSTRS